MKTGTPVTLRKPHVCVAEDDRDGVEVIQAARVAVFPRLLTRFEQVVTVQEYR
ncbi:MAG: hypothetical protein U0223_06435 [Nitrospira sp.]